MMRDPKILEFGKKITCIPHPDFGKLGPDGRPAFISKVEIVARGQTFVEEISGLSAGSVEGTLLKEQELIEKFRHNGERVLTQNQIDQAIDAFQNMEKLSNISQAMDKVAIL